MGCAMPLIPACAACEEQDVHPQRTHATSPAATLPANGEGESAPMKSGRSKPLRVAAARRAWRRALLALSAIMLLSALATLACTANDTLFIHLAETPAPTITPTPLA